MTKAKNFTIAKEEIPFKEEDLIVISSKGYKISILGTTYERKVEQVAFRQKILMDNLKAQISIKNKIMFSDEREKKNLSTLLDNLNDANNRIIVEIAKYKFAAKLEAQSPIPDSEDFKNFIIEYNNNKLYIDIQQSLYTEILNNMILQNSKFFSKFTGRMLKQSTTDSFVSFIKPILEYHGYRASKISAKQLADKSTD